MIPKTIHYCWFGGKPLPSLAEKCLKSWAKYCPDYQIKRWDETNFDVNICRYVKEAYEARKYAFVTDFVRLWVLVKFGGIYMDTDVEVLKSLDPILQYHAVSGFEDEFSIPTGLMASEKGFALFSEFLNEYKDISFILPNGTYDTIANVVRITNTCVKYGLIRNNTLQEIRGFMIFPKEYFCPKEYATGKINITPNTLTIHHYMSSWISKGALFRLNLRHWLTKYCPVTLRNKIFKLWEKLR